MAGIAGGLCVAASLKFRKRNPRGLPDLLLSSVLMLELWVGI